METQHNLQCMDPWPPLDPTPVSAPHASPPTLSPDPNLSSIAPHHLRLARWINACFSSLDKRWYALEKRLWSAWSNGRSRSGGAMRSGEGEKEGRERDGGEWAMDT